MILMYLLFVYFILRVQSESFKVCGAYCGPGWCNNDWIHETKCNDTFPTLSCADLCCHDHDICCGHNSNITLCNKMLVDCLSYCEPFSNSCKFGGLPVPPVVIADAMQIVIHWCCGSPCDETTHVFPQTQKHLYI